MYENTYQHKVDYYTILIILITWEINEDGIITSGFDFTRETVEDLLEI